MNDDSSSCYSADINRDREQPGVDSYEELLRPLPTQPVTIDIEHQIRDIGGSTVSAEFSPVRLQTAKKNVPKSPEEQKRHLEYDLTSLEWENKFFESCHDIFEHAIASIIHVSDALISQSQHAALQRMWHPYPEPPPSKEFMRDAVDKINAQIDHVHQKENTAKSAWLDKWKQQKKDVEFVMPWI